MQFGFQIVLLGVLKKSFFEICKIEIKYNIAALEICLKIHN